MDVEGALSAAEAAQRRSFALTNEDYNRLPGLVNANKLNVEQSYRQLFGPMDAGTQNQMTTRSIERSLGATGGGDPMATIGGAGSASGNAFATSLANMFQTKQDYDRPAWQQAVGQNPLQDIAPGGAEAAQLSVFNTQGQAGANQAAYGANVQNANMRNAAEAQRRQQEIATALAITMAITSIASASDKRLKKNIKKVGVSPSGVPIKEFSYKGTKTKYVGAMAQDVEKKFPEAVFTDNKGMKSVAYGMTDVPFFMRGGL